MLTGEGSADGRLLQSIRTSGLNHTSYSYDEHRHHEQMVSIAEKNQNSESSNRVAQYSRLVVFCYTV
jgi:hypothetical protein